MIIYKDKFPAEFGQKSRLRIAKEFDRFIEFIDRDTAEIEAKYWMELKPDNVVKYNEMLRSVRLMLRDEGVYDSRMLRIIRQLRCKETPAAAECAEQVE